jgi:hypothetical protein
MTGAKAGVLSVPPDFCANEICGEPTTAQTKTAPKKNNFKFRVTFVTTEIRERVYIVFSDFRFGIRRATREKPTFNPQRDISKSKTPRVIPTREMRTRSALMTM